MKKWACHLFTSIIVSICLLLNIGNLFSQQVLNGGFEDTTEFNFESNWEIAFGFNCFDPPFPVFARIVNDSNSGNNAAQLSSDMCYPEEVLAPGTIYTNDNEPNSPSFGYEYHERPANLNYYYKYMPAIQGEISYVKIMLFKFDYSNYSVTEVIGVGESGILESATYTLQTVPIDYYTGSVPDYLHILFSTSDGFSYYQNQPFYNPNVDNVNSLGTNLWIDDIYLSGGTIGIIEVDSNEIISIYPNPAQDRVKIKSKKQITKITISDVLGHDIQIIDNFILNAAGIIELDVSTLSSGLFFIKIENKVKKFVKE